MPRKPRASGSSVFHQGVPSRQVSFQSPLYLFQSYCILLGPRSFFPGLLAPLGTVLPLLLTIRETTGVDGPGVHWLSLPSPWRVPFPLLSSAPPGSFYKLLSDLAVGVPTLSQSQISTCLLGTLDHQGREDLVPWLSVSSATAVGRVGRIFQVTVEGVDVVPGSSCQHLVTSSTTCSGL